MTALDSTPIPSLGSRPSFQKLRELVHENPTEGKGWDNAWRRAVTPWNAGKCQPPLEDLIHSKLLDLPRGGRALVPGCGRGYETAVIADLLGNDTIGLDISPTAIQHAKTIHADYPVAAPGKVAFEVSDFFKYTVSSEGHFDLIFDYLFFVAISPESRKDWGRQVNALIKPGGYLVALIYPIEAESDLGPPYFVRSKHYTDNLGEGWSVALDIIPKTSLASHMGIERLVAWKKEA